MKKLFLGMMMLLVLSGCTQTVTMEFQLIEEDEETRYDTTEVITGKDDFVTKMVTTSTIEFLNEDEFEESKERLTKLMEELKACPYGVYNDDDKMIGCSKYITVDWKIEGQKFTIIETRDYESANKNKEDVYSEEAGGVYETDKYYSMEQFETDFLAEGYTKIK